MDDLKKALPHLFMATVVIVAVGLLAVDHLVSGGEAFGAILGASGFTLGVTGASSSISAAAATVPDSSPLFSAAVEQMAHPTAAQTPAPTPPAA
jgi:hypothetical protein